MMTYRQRSRRNSLLTRFFRVSHKSSKSLYVVPHQSNLLHQVQLHHPHRGFAYFCNLLGLNRYPLRLTHCLLRLNQYLLNHCLLRLNQYILNHYLLRLNCQDHDENTQILIGHVVVAALCHSLIRTFVLLIYHRTPFSSPPPRTRKLL